MRSLLLVSILAASSTTAYASKATVTIREVEVSGKADAKAVTTTLKRSSTKLIECFKKDPAAANIVGDVVATFSIEAKGTVATAQAPGLTDSLSACLSGVLAKLTFSKPKDGLPVGVSAHLHFDSGAVKFGLTDDTRVSGSIVGGPASDGTVGLGTIGTSGYSGSTGYGSGYGRLPAKKSPVTLGTAKIRGDLDPAIVRRYVMRYRNRLGYCYEKEQIATPTLAGKLTVDFTIDADGKVSSASAKGVHANLETCVANAIKAIEFPKPKTPGDVTVSYPLTFKPATK